MPRGDLIMRPAHAALIQVDISRIRVRQPRRAVAVAREPLVCAVVVLALDAAGDVLAEVAVERGAVVVLCGCLALELRAAHAEHTPVL